MTRHRASRDFTGRIGPPVAFVLALVFGTASIGKSTQRVAASSIQASNKAAEACFLLYELGVGEVRRAPDSPDPKPRGGSPERNATGVGPRRPEGNNAPRHEPVDPCRLRVTPASTFKIPHALAALDAGVLQGADTTIPYAGSGAPFPTWERDHTLASAMRYSVVWYFQRVAEKLGPEREREYLRKLDYGNADSSSGLTTFWLGGSLLVSPEEELQLLVRLYQNDLPLSDKAMQTVRDILVQPRGMVVNATGKHPFGGTWPEGLTLSAKTGSAKDRTGSEVRWLVGHVQRDHRAWVFVSCVVGSADVAPLAAVELAARALHEEQLL